MKDEILCSVAWSIFWLLLLIVLFASMCDTADAQTTVHTQGSHHRYQNGTSSFNRTTTITSPTPVTPPQQSLYINPFYEKAVQMDAKEEARKCASFILGAIHMSVWADAFRPRVGDLSEEDQAAFRKRILQLGEDLTKENIEDLLDEAEITNELVKEKP